jgi:uncharacterized membrane protein
MDAERNTGGQSGGGRTQKSVPDGAWDPGAITALSHFYRGELGRIMAWRTRLDSTTNWAVTASGTMFTVAFSVESVPHILFFFNIAVVAVLLWIEARRYRFYDAFRARVRMLEAHFLVPILAKHEGFLQGDWRTLVCEDLLLPSFKISQWEAVGRRLKRNYAYLFLLILAAWITKIFLHAPKPITSLHAFYEALRVGVSVPCWMVATILGGTFLLVMGMLVWISTQTPGEFSEMSGHRSQWRI